MKVVNLLHFLRNQTFCLTDDTTVETEQSEEETEVVLSQHSWD